MDSGNSGSMQSSSGGDEEYDSRPESLSSAFLNSSSHHFVPSLLSLRQQQQQPATLFDPSPNLFHAFSQSQQNPNHSSSLLNLDLVQSQGLRSDPADCTDLGNHLVGSSSSSQSSLLGAPGSRQGLAPSLQLRSGHGNGARSSAPSDQTHGVARNPKKRTRASRRAPTTVLTTDTSNFRQMVQEFTGIPAPPFSGSPFTRRLDLFGPGSGLRSGHLETMGSLYPLRPSAQKVHQQSPFLSSSSPSLLSNNIVDATNIASTSTPANNNNTLTTAATSTFHPSSVNYQLSAGLGLNKQHPNVLNMQNQNQMLSIQPLLQSPRPLLQPALVNDPSFGAKSQSSLPLPSFEDLGMGHGHVNANLGGLPSRATTEGMGLSNDGSHEDYNLRSLDGNYGNNMQRFNSCKLNFSSASSSDFHHDKGVENVPSRGTEGTVDSWICPSEFRIGDH